MSATRSSSTLLPPDPTFPPSAYERTSRILRLGVVGFFLLASVGMILGLLERPGETVAQLLSTNPRSEYGSAAGYFTQLAALEPSAVVLLGIFLMVSVTVGRVAYATFDFYQGRERILAAVSATVVFLLILGLFVVAPFVH